MNEIGLASSTAAYTVFTNALQVRSKHAARARQNNRPAAAAIRTWDRQTDGQTDGSQRHSCPHPTVGGVGGIETAGVNSDLIA